MQKDLIIDDTCVVGFWVGELGWFLQRYQALLRYHKHVVHPDHKFIIFCNKNLHVFVNDFTYATVDLPKWFTDLKLDSDCYEAVLPDSPAGSLMPANIYSALTTSIRQKYKSDNVIELFPPRGCNYWVDSQKQVFCQYKTDKIHSNRPIIVVFPRARVRASNRNVPQFVWYELVENLKKTCTVVLAGVPSGACLVDYSDPNVINLIAYDKDDKTELLIKYLNSAYCSVSSQSGGTHISLLSGCPSYIIGHEADRHTVHENRLDVPTSFRYVTDYRAIDALTILQDLDRFVIELKNNQWIPPDKTEDEVISDSGKVLKEIIGKQRNE